MHQLNVLILGPSSFFNTINELKPFLKFNPLSNEKNVDFDIILFHEKILENQKSKDFILKSKLLKIYISNKRNLSVYCDEYLQIPTTLKDEIQTNIFLRYNDPDVKAMLNLKKASDLEIFSKLRDLKDDF